jgi:hypothetical protein
VCWVVQAMASPMGGGGLPLVCMPSGTPRSPASPRTSDVEQPPPPLRSPASRMDADSIGALSAEDPIAAQQSPASQQDGAAGADEALAGSSN